MISQRISQGLRCRYQTPKFHILDINQRLQFSNKKTPKKKVNNRHSKTLSSINKQNDLWKISQPKIFECYEQVNMKPEQCQLKHSQVPKQNQNNVVFKKLQQNVDCDKRFSHKNQSNWYYQMKQNQNNRYQLHHKNISQEQKIIQVSPNYKFVEHTHSLSFKNMKIQDFQVGLVRSEDFLGKMYPARHLISGFLCCIKTIDKKEGKKCIDKLAKSIKIQVKYFHRNLIQIYGIFMDIQNIYLIMQYHQSAQLTSKMNLQGNLQEKQALNCIHSITKPILMVHKKQQQFGPIFLESVVSIHSIWKLSDLTFYKRLWSLSQSQQIDNRNLQKKPKQLVQILFLLEMLLTGKRSSRKIKRKLSDLQFKKKQLETKCRQEVQKQKISPIIFEKIFKKYLWDDQQYTIKQFVQAIQQLIQNQFSQNS